MSADLIFRPIDTWPGVLRADADRQTPQFSAVYSSTIELLHRELELLKAERAVIQLALASSDIRRDGLPRVTARPEHPGVILSFDSPYGPLRYLTDTFTGRSVWRPSAKGGTFRMEGWQANLRAIALGLENLRAVDRYGITKRGEQYRGWAELPAGTAMPATHMTRDDAARFIAEHAGHPESWELLRDDATKGRRVLASSYRQAAHALHPDRGGDAGLFQRLQAAKALLDRETARG